MIALLCGDRLFLDERPKLLACLLRRRYSLHHGMLPEGPPGAFTGSVRRYLKVSPRHGPVMLAATGDLVLLAALPVLVAIDWATRQRR